MSREIRGERAYLTPEDIETARPAPHPPRDGAALMEARQRMIATGQWNDMQFMGRRWPIGCVALEITQRCNLDCAACYLSENSEAVMDMPLEEVFRRIDRIFDYYGPNTDVQVTGGDPTLRKRAELIEIVRRIRQKGMRPTLFTNGIRAKRDLLKDSWKPDVAFHVDMTQQRKGFANEIELNAIRQEYIERARGLRLAIMFNTTVINDNFDQIPEIVAFFVRNADIVRLASFQIQADTGRGVLGRRDARLSVDSVKSQIERGTVGPLSFETVRAGHFRCNRYAMSCVVNGRVYDVLDDQRLFADILEQTKHLQLDRQDRSAALATIAKGVLGCPPLVLRAAGWLARKVWRARLDLVRARGRVHKLSFFIHDFMDACRLEPDRIEACVFAAATADGPISMCLHNAKRDAFILQHIRLAGEPKGRFWNPLTGTVTDHPEQPALPGRPNRKSTKGRARRALADLTALRLRR